MLIIPAIDIKDGEVVRLYKGNYNKKTVYSKNIAELAIEFENIGAKYLHIVDLDGAKDGKCKNYQIIKEIRKSTKISIEIGGGIRDEKIVRMYLEELGINRIILGTSAIKNTLFLKEMLNKYGNEKIIVGVDVNSGYLSLDGWVNTSKIKYLDFIKKIEKMGVKYIVATDISKDGTLTRTEF